MRISFIIPAINEAENIRRAVESAWRAGAAEVIVVDGGSTDGTLELAADLPCQLVGSAPGRGLQQNVGAAHAEGEILLFQHADNFFEANVQTQIETALVGSQASFGAFRQRIDATGALYRLLERGNASRVAQLGAPYGDQGIFVSRKLFFEQGGFPDTPLMEDVILMRRLRKLGWPILLPGPLRVSARRWKRHGVIRQTLRNWSIVTLHRCGVSPRRLAEWYRRHDVVGSSSDRIPASTGSAN